MGNQEYFNELKKLMVIGQIDGDELKRRVEATAPINDQQTMDKIRQLILESEEKQKNRKMHGIRAFLPSHFNSASYRVAAVLLLLIVGGAFWYYREQTQVTPPAICEEVQLAITMSRQSGRAAAEVETVNAQQSSPITREERALYHVDDHFAEQLAEAKRITTYQDKEYWVTLDDGTLVHLNHNSRLVYPEKFGDRRDVIFDGEAYFMVATDKSRQFVVHTPQGDIRVYGTEFAVNTKVGENGNTSQRPTPNIQLDNSQLVLIRGSIGFKPVEGKEMMLKPGQELSVMNSQLSVKDVDTTPYEAWNTGKFVFDNCPLEQLTDVLARWYGMKVRFKNDASRHILFTGILSRYADVKTSLQSIAAVADAEITVDNNTIQVK